MEHGERGSAVPMSNHEGLVFASFVTEAAQDPKNKTRVDQLGPGQELSTIRRDGEETLAHEGQYMLLEPHVEEQGQKAKKELRDYSVPPPHPICLPSY